MTAEEDFAAAQKAVADRVLAVMGIPPARVGNLLDDAVWKTDADTRVGHLVYLNQPLCPQARAAVLEWWPGYTATSQCPTCTGIAEHARAIARERSAATDDRQADAAGATGGEA